MKKVSCIIIFFLQFQSSLYGLDFIDSLRQVLPAQTGQEKVDTYLELGKVYYRRFGYTDSLLFYGEKANDLALKESYDTGIINSLSAIGVGFYGRDEVDSTIRYFGIALEKAVEIGDSLETANMLYRHAAIYYNASNYHEAMKYYLQAIMVFEELGNFKGLANCYLGVGGIFGFQKNNIERFHYLRKAIGAAEFLEEKDASIKAEVYSKVSSQYIATANSIFSRRDTAELLARKGLRLSRNHNLKPYLPSFYNIMAAIMYFDSLYLESLAYCDSVHYYRKYSNKSTLSVMYSRKSDALGKLGRYDEAFLYLDSLRSSVNKGAYSMFSLSYKVYILNKMKGDLPAALEGLENARSWDDSLRNLEVQSISIDLEEKYQSEKKVAEIKDLKQQDQIAKLKIKKQGYWIIGFLGFITFAILLVIILNQRRKQIELRSIAILRQQLLRSQINPHFFFNALMAIQSFIILEPDRKKSAIYLSKFATLMRLVLENSMHDFIPFHAELETLKHYLDLQKARFRHKFDFKIKSPNDPDQIALLVPPMVAQPYIENAIEHGLKGIDSGGLIIVKFYFQNELFHCIIEDNGIGMTKSPKQGSHIPRAMEIMNSRVQLLKSKNKRVSIKVESIGDFNENKNGVRVSLSLPYEH